MRISEWSSDVCSSDLLCRAEDRIGDAGGLDQLLLGHLRPKVAALEKALRADDRESHMMPHAGGRLRREKVAAGRSEENTSELQSLMRISYAVFCLKIKNISQ